jgi:acetyl esterase/lipase
MLADRLAAIFESACDRLGFLAINAPAFFGAFKRHANRSYGSDPQHRLDVYEPRAAAAAPRPVVVFWHGGRWRFGDKADYRFVGAALAGCGCVAVLPNYRHYPQVKMPGFMDDAARAALWAVAHAGDFGGDHRRVYLMGHSAGAHMAALLTLDSRYFTAAGQPAPHVAGVIGLSGAYDFCRCSRRTCKTCLGRRRTTRNPSPSISCAPERRPCCWCMAWKTRPCGQRTRAISRRL